MVSGTGTGVGKTVLTTLLARRARELGQGVSALKPLCSGGRGDAVLLRAAGDPGRTLDDVNPWHFRASLAPLMAARREGRRISLGEVLRFVRSARRRGGVVLVEGAGGLRSPLGEDFDTRDLLVRLGATPVVVGANRLGVLNEVLLTVDALPIRPRSRAVVVLMTGARRTVVADTNVEWLGARLGPDRVVEVPWIRGWPEAARKQVEGAVIGAVDRVWKALGASWLR